MISKNLYEIKLFFCRRFVKALIQRVTSGSVKVDGSSVGSIGHGIVLLVGFSQEDHESKLLPMAKKISELRIFSDENGRFNFSLLDIKGEILAVPQFTLYADTQKGRRPDFARALAPEKASLLFDKFLISLRETGIRNVQSGVFGAHMEVSIVNDGPVTIILKL